MDRVVWRCQALVAVPLYWKRRSILILHCVPNTQVHWVRWLSKVFSSARKNMGGQALSNNVWKLGNSHWKQQCLWTDSCKPKARILPLSLKSMFIKLIIVLKVEKYARDWHLVIRLLATFIFASWCVGTPSKFQKNLSMESVIPKQSNRKATKCGNSAIAFLTLNSR